MRAFGSKNPYRDQDDNLKQTIFLSLSNTIMFFFSFFQNEYKAYSGEEKKNKTKIDFWGKK